MNVSKETKKYFNKYNSLIKSAENVEELMIGKQELLFELVSILQKIETNKTKLKGLISALKNFHIAGSFNNVSIKKHVKDILIESIVTAEWNFAGGIKSSSHQICMPLRSRDCYFCYEGITSCENCLYGKIHGECSKEGSDYREVINEIDLLNDKE